MSLEPSSPLRARGRASARAIRERTNGIRACYGSASWKANRSFRPLQRILARTMVTDFLRLVFLYNNRADLEEWNIRYMLSSFDHEEHRLVESARELRLNFASELASQVRQGKTEWEQRAKASGVKKRTFPTIWSW